MPNFDLADETGYLHRMSLPLQDKLKGLTLFPEVNSGKALDVGCADGVVTHALATLRPNWKFHGIDLNAGFIEKANQDLLPNLDYEVVYLRDLLAREDKYNVVSFFSVLHEFATYGEGISSFVKAIADAHELLLPNGVIVIRDMALPDELKKTDKNLGSIIDKIQASKFDHLLSDFVNHWGQIENLYQLNHFLLKYLYEDNWNSELKENYVAVSIEQYISLFKLLGMNYAAPDTYLLDYLKNRWTTDFDLDEEEISPLKSTTLLSAMKV